MVSSPVGNLKNGGCAVAEKYLNYIGGKCMAAAGGEFFENRNPADTDDLLGLFPKSSAAESIARLQKAQIDTTG